MVVKNSWLKRSVQSTVLVYFLLLIVVPIVGVYVQGLSGGWAKFVESITQPIAWDAVYRTIKLALIATVINTAVGTLIAWVLVRYKFPGRRLLNSLVDLPFALPTAVGGLMILLLLGPQSWLGSFLKGYDIEIVYQPTAIVIAMIFVTFPFVIRTIQPLLEELDPTEEEASFTLGASRSGTFWRVIFPAMRSGVVGGAMLAFSRALAEFGAVVLVAGNIPGKTLTASVQIYGNVESANSTGAAAVSVLLLTLSFVVLWSVNLLTAGRDAR
ncbi:sulfate ABC transporter permease subunit CysT [Tumebacillus sp. ITR2]|uniref:Molybdenum transport system permease n=1 Tax=Tumebacillus amylolyticus TaxID=2801339 RepID=A0ABS1J8S0_9BACL|nr:sulfate ABC transporter permease subunit CysT [Tumebacillus amylolyticus]MBL0386671.1 sulfate ABC transporter permease subunit CysT [Tumebacillus amylolyticus]